MTHGKRPTEERLAIGIAAVQEDYERFDIEWVGLIREEHNPADGIKKLRHNRKLEQLLVQSKDNTSVEQRIMRSPDTKNSCVQRFEDVVIERHSKLYARGQETRWSVIIVSNKRTNSVQERIKLI